MTGCNCGHPRSFHHDGTEHCQWPDCGCSIFEATDEDEAKGFSPVTPVAREDFTYDSNPRLHALRHVHTPGDDEGWPW